MTQMDEITRIVAVEYGEHRNRMSSRRGAKFPLASTTSSIDTPPCVHLSPIEIVVPAIAKTGRFCHSSGD